MDVKQARERAHHQAGRAVVCVTLFGERVIKLLSIDERHLEAGGFETYSRLPVPLSCRPPSHKRGEERTPISVEGIVDAHGVLAYSGIAAEHELLARDADGTPPSEEELRAGTDASRARLAELASSIGLERPADHFYDEYWDEAHRLLGSGWEAVERVADALIGHTTLNGNRVDGLILGEDVR
jgi:hypothetical protein